jgi:hypothetical protein
VKKSKYYRFVKNTEREVVDMYLLPKLKGKEIILYLRKSRADDPLLTVEEVLEKHEQLIADWTAQAMPDLGEIPPENTYREVVSGETLDGRPKMQELLRRVESPDVKAILCKEPSRLSRGDLQDIGYLVKILRYTGTLVLTPRGCYDLRDDRDREQFERELMRGNDYLEYQKKLMYDGKLIAVRKGHFIGSRAPYGYKKTSFKEGGRTCRTLEPHPEEAPVVKRIFELYSSGIGTVRICDVLDAEHIKPMDNDKWSANSVNEILQNPHYIGKVRWNSQKEQFDRILLCEYTEMKIDSISELNLRATTPKWKTQKYKSNLRVLGKNGKYGIFDGEKFIIPTKYDSTSFSKHSKPLR